MSSSTYVIFYQSDAVVQKLRNTAVSNENNSVLLCNK